MENRNLPAFPTSYAATPAGDVYNSFHEGMGGLTKREYIAAMAMQGWLASYAGVDVVPDPQVIASKVVKITDALLAELEK
jgi:hypothetical protein